MSGDRTAAALAFPFRQSVHLDEREAFAVMDALLGHELSSEQIISFLRYLRSKGETVAELVGCAKAIRARARAVLVPSSDEPVVDTCGTGGDGVGTFNISTAAAFVLAGAGVRVAKHGNRKISSNCGSWDVLEALGIRPDLETEQLAECFAQTGLVFLYAPQAHSAMAVASEARRSLGGRTVFNLLGPLTNPVRASMQVIGAYSVRAAELLAQASLRLGLERAFVVHGADGLDEITLTGETTVFQVEDGSVQKGRWTPEDFGVGRAEPSELNGGDVATNAELLRSILSGETGPRRDVVVINTAAALLLARKADTLSAAVSIAAESIDSGAAREKLESLRNFSASLAHESV